MNNLSRAIVDGIALLTRLHGAPLSSRLLFAEAARTASGDLDIGSLSDVLHHHGFKNTISHRDLDAIHPGMLPVLLLLHDGRAVVLTEIIGDGAHRSYSIQEKHEESVKTENLSYDELAKHYEGSCWFVQPKLEQDKRSELPEYSFGRAWFWKIIWRYRSYYYSVILSSFLINFLALVGSLYVMNVYDRVVPNRAMETLWALSIGVVLANIFEFVARMIRAKLTDIAGKKADLVISAALFRRLLALDLTQKPASAGSYANNLREFESVREFMTSVSLLALVDLPFLVLYIFVIGLVAGPLAWVPIITIPIVVTMGLLVQKPMAFYINQSMREGSQRQGMAVEAIEGLETLKTNNASNWVQSRWERFTATTASSSMKVKDLTNLVINFSQLSQQLNTVFVIVWGTYLVHSPNPSSRITMGAMIATVILCGRALAPLSQVAGLMIRIQQTRTALQGIDAIVARKVDRDLDRQYIGLQHVTGALAFHNVSFRYAEQGALVIQGMNLTIKPGEKVAILGRIGSGKSTLLRLAAGLYGPTDGYVSLDDMDIRQIEPNDVRAHITLLSQQPRLFLGTLRENLQLGRADSTVDDQILMAELKRFGLDQMVLRHPLGLNMPIGEDGQGLSGGQKQMLCLARLTLRDPKVVLLDEPTSGLDDMSERFALQALAQWAQNKILIIVTHRLQVLPIVERIVVIHEGKVAVEGPRDVALRHLGVLRDNASPPPQTESVSKEPANP